MMKGAQLAEDLRILLGLPGLTSFEVELNDKELKALPLQADGGPSIAIGDVGGALRSAG